MVGRLERGAVGAHVLHPGLRVAGHDVGGSEGGRGIKARRGDGNRQHVQALACTTQRGTGVHHVLTGRLLHFQRRDRLGNGAVPLGLNLIHRGIHAGAVDGAVGSQGAHHHRNLEFAALAIDDVVEQKGLALALGHAADELPAHQRMQLGILVDTTADDLQQTTLLQTIQMLMQVGIAEVFGTGGDFAAGLGLGNCLGNCLGARLGGGLAGRFGCDFAHDLGSGALRVLGHADFL